MPFTHIRALVAIVGFTTGLVAGATAVAAAVELPKLSVTNPIPRDKYISASNIAITGEFRPAFNTNVNVGVFHVLPNGLVVRQTGCSFSPREDGKFAITLEPPGGNWIPGLTRVVISLENLRQVKQAVEFQVTGEAVAVPLARAKPDSRPSDLVVKLPLADVKVFELPAGITYLVEGSLKSNKHLGNVTGPSILGEAVHVRDDDSRVTADSAFSPSFIQSDGTCFYQIQLKSPETPGLYHLRFKTIPPGAADGDPFGAGEFPFAIRVVDAGVAPKP